MTSSSFTPISIAVSDVKAVIFKNGIGTREDFNAETMFEEIGTIIETQLEWPGAFLAELNHAGRFEQTKAGRNIMQFITTHTALLCMKHKGKEWMRFFQDELKALNSPFFAVLFVGVLKSMADVLPELRATIPDELYDSHQAALDNGIDGELGAPETSPGLRVVEITSAADIPADAPPEVRALIEQILNR